MPTNLQEETWTAEAAPELTGERAGRGMAQLLGRWWVAFAASAVFVVSGHLLIKAGLNSLTAAPPGTGLAGRILHLLLQPAVAGGLMVYVSGTVCWMRAVSQKEISFLYPLSSLNYVLVAAASMIIFHEVISPRRAAGVLLVVTGMILMNRRSRERAA